MRLEGGEESQNVEDIRGSSPGPGMMMAGGGLGTLVIALIVMFLGGDPQRLLQQAQQGQVQGGGDVDPAQEPLVKLVKIVLGDTEKVWHEQFRVQLRKQYREPKLVIFNGQVKSGCGLADAGMGPFYCPADEKVYIDLRFYDEMKKKFGAPGDFAQAYVIAHEVGHHIQKQLGQSDYVHQMKARVSEQKYNQLSVALELQADFYAGVWARHAEEARGILEQGDLEEAINAATAIGDDRLQKQGQGYVQPEKFTHGSSAQRVRWFKKGFQSGRIEDGDTFSIPYERL